MGNEWTMNGQCMGNVFAMYEQCKDNELQCMDNVKDNVLVMYGQCATLMDQHECSTSSVGQGGRSSSRI